MKEKHIEGGIKALKAGVAHLLYDEVIPLTSDIIRGCVTASKGNKLVISDLSNIEGRVLAWLAGEEWKVKAFKDFDAGAGHDLYKLAYARSFNIPPEKVSKEQRQLGKVMELALGYQGSVGAFTQMSAVYNVSLPEETVRDLVKAWRKANAYIQSFWYALEEATKIAIANPSKDYECRKLIVRRDKNWLRIILPSGRSLCYASPKINDEGQITYMGVNQYTRKWERLETYGGKLVENATQAIARDIMANNMVAIEEAGYPIVLSVHDELLTDTPDTAKYSHKELSALLATNPPWAEGLPLAAAGFETFRYRKED